MALGAAVLTDDAGSLRASFAQRMTIVGDDAYPTGGTLEFAETYLLAELGVSTTIVGVSGYGFTGAALTHFCRYDAANDALLVYVLAGTQVPNATDISGVTFDLVVTYQ